MRHFELKTTTRRDSPLPSTPQLSDSSSNHPESSAFLLPADQTVRDKVSSKLVAFRSFLRSFETHQSLPQLSQRSPHILVRFHANSFLDEMVTDFRGEVFGVAVREEKERGGGGDEGV